MSVSFKGIREEYVTFQCASGLTAGTPVKLTANGPVGACSAGERFMGATAGASPAGHALAVRRPPWDGRSLSALPAA